MLASLQAIESAPNLDRYAARVDEILRVNVGRRDRDGRTREIVRCPERGDVINAPPVQLRQHLAELKMAFFEHVLRAGPNATGTASPLRLVRDNLGALNEGMQLHSAAFGHAGGRFSERGPHTRLGGRFGRGDARGARRGRTRGFSRGRLGLLGRFEGT